MPFIGGKFYMNPAYGRAVEGARGVKAASEHHEPHRQDQDAHWVTIDHRHVLIQATQAGGSQHTPFPPLTPKSKQAIDEAMGKGSANALLWGYAFLHAGAQNGVDPNLLVGLAARESGLHPHAKNSTAQGMFQITPRRQADLGLSDHDLFNPNVVVNAVADSLARATKTFNGNTSLAIASWTVGTAGTRAAFEAHGMQGVRNLLLDRAHPSYGRVGPQYVDFVTSFQSK
jgi:soluble lytic murein transglycosylase-like protein